MEDGWARVSERVVEVVTEEVFPHALILTHVDYSFLYFMQVVEVVTEEVFFLVLFRVVLVFLLSFVFL